MRIEKDHSLLNHNTFGIEIVADAFVEYNDAAELEHVRSLLKNGELPSPYLHIGAGSNILFTKPFKGTILHSAITGIKKTDANGEMVTLSVGSGTMWDDFVKEAVEEGWWGAENLSLIPGETGAAAAQNIGAYGKEIKDIVKWVKAFDMESGKSSLFGQNECGYSYRESIFKHPENKKYIITEVGMELSLVPRPDLSYRGVAAALEKSGREATLKGIRETIIGIRRSKLPDTGEFGSAGSFFKNPIVPRSEVLALLDRYPQMPHYPADKAGSVKLSAGWLIDQCGWRGAVCGRAGVYSNQALVLINRGGATGEEILSLAEKISLSVREKFGVELNPEVNIL